MLHQALCPLSTFHTQAGLFSPIYAADVMSVFDAGATGSPEREGRQEKTPAMRSVCVRQVGQPEGVSCLLPGMYLSPRALEMEAPPHLLSSPGQWVGKPQLRYSLPTCHRTDSKAGVPPPPAISPAPFPEGTVLSPKPAPSCTPVPSPPHAVLTSSQVPRDEAEEDADDVTQVRFAAVLALLQPQGRVRSWARGLPAPRHPGTRPRDPSFWPTGHSPGPQPLCPLCPLSPEEGTQSLCARALAPTSVCLPISVPVLWVSVVPLSRPLRPVLPSSLLVLTSPALGLSQDRLPSSPALHLAPDPGCSGPGCSLSLETEGLLQLPGLGGCEGGVGPVPEFRHSRGRCPRVIFNPGCDHTAEGPYPGRGASLQPGRGLPCPRRVPTWEAQGPGTLGRAGEGWQPDLGLALPSDLRSLTPAPSPAARLRSRERGGGKGSLYC